MHMWINEKKKKKESPWASNSHFKQKGEFCGRGWLRGIQQKVLVFPEGICLLMHGSVPLCQSVKTYSLHFKSKFPLASSPQSTQAWSPVQEGQDKTLNLEPCTTGSGTGCLKYPHLRLKGTHARRKGHVLSSVTGFGDSGSLATGPPGALDHMHS
jgi:hypothetical protein